MNKKRVVLLLTSFLLNWTKIIILYSHKKHKCKGRQMIIFLQLNKCSGDVIQVLIMILKIIGGQNFPAEIRISANDVFFKYLFEHSFVQYSKLSKWRCTVHYCTLWKAHVAVKNRKDSSGKIKTMIKLCYKWTTTHMATKY